MYGVCFVPHNIAANDCPVPVYVQHSMTHDHEVAVMTSGLQLKQKRSRVAVIAEQREATTVTHSHKHTVIPCIQLHTYMHS